jgi:hypothetical protein
MTAAADKDSWSLDVIEIASPCEVSWEAMDGDERVRRCDACKLSVYNIAELSRAEAEELIRSSEGRLCVRFFRRSDGTILTRDCPVGLRAVRRQIARMVVAIGALIGFLTVGTVAATAGTGKRMAHGPLSRLVEWIDPSSGFFAVGEMPLSLFQTNVTPSAYDEETCHLEAEW